MLQAKRENDHVYYKRPPQAVPSLHPPQRLVKTSPFVLPQPHPITSDLASLDAFSAAPTPLPDLSTAATQAPLAQTTVSASQIPTENGQPSCELWWFTAKILPQSHRHKLDSHYVASSGNLPGIDARLMLGGYRLYEALWASGRKVISSLIKSVVQQGSWIVRFHRLAALCNTCGVFCSIRWEASWGGKRGREASMLEMAAGHHCHAHPCSPHGCWHCNLAGPPAGKNRLLSHWWVPQVETIRNTILWTLSQKPVS